MADILLTLQEALIYAPSLADAPAATVQAMIESASRMTESYCNRFFLSQNATERFQINYYPRVYLKRLPVTNIESISLYSLEEPVLSDSCGNVLGFESEQSNLTAKKVDEIVRYSLDHRSGKLEVLNQQLVISNPAKYYYEIAYTGGFDTCPSPVKLAVSMLTEAIYSQAKLDPSLMSEKIGDYSYTKSANQSLFDKSSAVSQILNPYVRFGINGI